MLRLNLFLKKSLVFVIIVLNLQNMKKFQKLKILNSTKTLVRSKKTPVLCTISGGQDSVLSFFVLLHGHSKESLHLFYCQHFWQLKNFFAERVIFQVSCLFKVCYTLSLPQIQNLTENESRQWRKKNYYRVSQLNQILTCITGHTETDTLEKNLNNLFRGTSPAGLSYCSFLNFENRTGRFFCTINLNTSSYYKRLQNEIFFVDFKKIKTKKTYVTSTNQSRNSERSDSSKNNQRRSFQFCKQKNSFLQNSHFSYISSNNKKNCRKCSGPMKNFYFSQKTKNTHKEIKFVESKSSTSFCFSSGLSNLVFIYKKPLEKTTRFTVSKVINLYQLPNIIDVTNFSFQFSRNKIRHQLLPFMRCLVQPKIEFVVTQFFEILNQENQGREKDLGEVVFISKLLTLTPKKNTLFSLHHTSLSNLWFIVVRIESDFLTMTKFKTNETVKKLEKIRISDFDLNLILINQSFIKKILKIVSRTTTGSLTQKLFFEYKNLNLKYSQNSKINFFY